MKNFTTIFAVTTIAMMVAITNPAYAVNLGDLFGKSNSSQKGDFLSVEEAFRVVPTVKGDKISITFDITKGHYVYQDKLKLTLPDGVTASPFTFDEQPHFVDDPNFGKVAVYDHETVIATTTLINNSKQDLANAPVSIKWQGCAKAGLCYPPEKIKVTVNLKKKVSR